MEPAPTLSIVIPTLNAGAVLGRHIAALVAETKLVVEIIVSDGGSADCSINQAKAAGAKVVLGDCGRGGQLARGAAAASGDWFLFLHADAALEKGWAIEAQNFMNCHKAKAAVFTLRFDERGLAPFLVAVGAMVRTHMFAAPYGDQGLLIPRALYDEIGGYRSLPLFEDVDIVDRIVAAKGRKAISVLKARAVTSADRYRRDGWAARVLKNSRCIAMYRKGVPVEEIVALYR